MNVPATAALALPLLFAANARAERPDPALAFLAGAAPALAGFVVGGALVGTSGDRSEQGNAGWLAIEGGFVLAPLLSHAVAGEWGRAAMFTAVPAASFAGTVALFEYAPNVATGGTLEQQRIQWILFGMGLFSAAVGVVDAVLTIDRAHSLHFTPGLSPVHGGAAASFAIDGVL
jgi:hypothetical protein